MFWRFGGYANISAIDTLLDKADVTLEELLDESDLIQEVKQHNTKLIEFLRDETIIRKLLEYVTAPKLSSNDIPHLPTPTSQEPNEQIEDTKEIPPASASKDSSAEKSDDQNVTSKPAETKSTTFIEITPLKTDAEREQAEKVRLKYSYVSCEVLSSEAWSICEAVMDNADNLQTFWKFLERPAPLDPLQAGYFTKVNETLLDKKTEEMMSFFKSIDNIVPMMLKHVDCPMIMDLLLKIISMEKSEGGQGIVDWLQSKDLISKLLSFLSIEHSSTTQTSTGDFLKAIITISANASQNEQSCIGPNNLTRQLVSEKCIQSLIDKMLKGGNPLTVGVGIIIEVIRKNNSDYDPEVAGGINSIPSGRDPIYLGHLLRLFARHVPDFMQLITSQEVTIVNPDGTTSTKKRELKAAFGATIEPLGFDRFKTCELMAELLHCSNMGLLNERGSEEYVRQRDLERDRLKLEREKELASMPIHKPDSIDERESVDMQDLPPKPPRKDDDDGFEDVTVTGTTNEAGVDHTKDNSVAAEPSSPTTTTTATDPANDNEQIDTIQETLQAPSQAVEPASPTTEIASNIKQISLEQDTVMQSPSPPPHEDGTSEENTTQSMEEPDEVMSSPPAAHDVSSAPGEHDSHLHASGSAQHERIEPELNKDLPDLPTDEIPKIAVGGEVVDLGLEPAFLHYEGTDLDFNGMPLVGDYLKMMFVQYGVVPTILDFFFRFPWNNFLHNVVYDVVQQVFNGPMDRGFNIHLAIDLFEKGQITQRIMDGDYDSYLAQKDSNMRLGYMGHLTLIAEEVVKFTDRHDPAMLSRVVMDKIMENNWILYVETTLAETRERDNAILGGVRPDLMPGQRQVGLGGVVASQNFGGVSQSGAADVGLDSIELQNSGIAEGGDIDASHDEAFGGSIDDHENELDNEKSKNTNQGRSHREGVSPSGFGSSSDDDDEDEEMAMGDDDEEEDVSRLGMSGRNDQFTRYISEEINQATSSSDDEEDDGDAMVGSSRNMSSRRSQKPSGILPLNFLRKGKGRSISPRNRGKHNLLTTNEIEARLQAVDSEARTENEGEEEGEGFMVEHEEMEYPDDFSREVIHVSSPSSSSSSEEMLSRPTLRPSKSRDSLLDDISTSSDDSDEVVNLLREQIQPSELHLSDAEDHDSDLDYVGNDDIDLGSTSSSEGEHNKFHAEDAITSNPEEDHSVRPLTIVKGDKSPRPTELLDDVEQTKDVDLSKVDEALIHSPTDSKRVQQLEKLMAETSLDG